MYANERFYLTFKFPIYNDQLKRGEEIHSFSKFKQMIAITSSKQTDEF